MHPRAARAALGAVSLVLLATSCSSADERARNAADPALSPSPIKQVDKDEAAIGRTLDAYATVVKRSLSHKPLPVGRIQAVTDGRYTTTLTKQLRRQHRAGLVMRGRDGYTTRSVTVRGSAGTLETCWDSAPARIVNTSVRPPAPVRPLPPTVVTFTLRKAAGVWAITGRRAGVAC